MILNLPPSLAEELKVWQMAFEKAYGRPVSFAEMIRGMLDSMPDTEPGVTEEFERLLQAHPEWEDKIREDY